MRVVYVNPNEGGWHPISHMVQLLAELLSADLVTLPFARMSNAWRRAMSLGPRRRAGGTCLVVAAWPTLLLGLLRSDYWFRGYDHVAGWIIDSFWVERIPFAIKHRGHFDQFFVTGAEDVEPWTAATGRPVTWLAWGSDVLNLGSGNPARPVDLQRVGRQPAGWEDDEDTKLACEAAGLTFQGRPSWYADATANQAGLMKRFSEAKFTLSFSNAVNPTSYTHPTREYLTARWTDALASGAVVAGIAPQCAATAELLWPGATLELETVDRSQGLQRIAEAVSAWDPDVARHNHQLALERLDWRWRFDQLATALGVKSEKLDRDLDLLRETLRLLGPRGHER